MQGTQGRTTSSSSNIDSAIAEGYRPGRRCRIKVNGRKAFISYIGLMRGKIVIYLLSYKKPFSLNELALA